MLGIQRKNLPSVGWLMKAPFKAVAKLTYLAARSCLPIYREKIINDEIAHSIISSKGDVKSYALSRETIVSVKLDLWSHIVVTHQSPGGCIGAGKVAAAVTIGSVTAAATSAVTGVMISGTPAGAILASVSGAAIPTGLAIGISVGLVTRTLVEKSAWYHYSEPKCQKFVDFTLNHRSILLVFSSAMLLLVLCNNITPLVSIISELVSVGAAVEETSWLIGLGTIVTGGVVGLISAREATMATARFLASEEVVFQQKIETLKDKIIELKAAKKHEADAEFIKIAIDKMRADEKQKVVAKERDSSSMDDAEQISNEQQADQSESFNRLTQRQTQQINYKSDKAPTPLISRAVSVNEEDRVSVNKGTSQLQKGAEEMKARTHAKQPQSQGGGDEARVSLNLGAAPTAATKEKDAKQTNPEAVTQQVTGSVAVSAAAGQEIQGHLPSASGAANLEQRMDDGGAAVVASSAVRDADTTSRLKEFMGQVISKCGELTRLRNKASVAPVKELDEIKTYAHQLVREIKQLKEESPEFDKPAHSRI